MKHLALAGALAMLGVAGGGAQTPSLDDTLASVRRPIALRDGRLEGAGADLLRVALQSTPYVLIGEDHGLAEIPAFSAAIFRDLAGRGVRDLVLEVGPEAGRRLTRAVGAADPEAEVRDWVRQYPFSLAFYDLVQEFEFLRQARAAAGPGLRITGVDQELMGASRMLLESVASKDDAIPGLLSLERQAYERAVASGNPLDLFMLTGPADALAALRDRLARGSAPRDAALVASILDSRGIYALNAQSGYQSNLTRAALMKRSYVDQIPPDLRAAPPPALFKFGAYHVMKGLNLLESREIGNYVAEMADGRGTPSLHLLVMAVKGRQRRFAGVGTPYVAAPVDQVGPGVSDFPFAKPVFERALAEHGWSLFDFREMRRWAIRQTDLDPRLLRMVNGFDLAVLIPEGTPSDQIR
ncbi:MAG: hypothetical protein AB7O93_19590 [Vicinamibacterales bacterium]